MKKNSGNEPDELLSENTYFLLFKDGDEVFSTLNEIVNENHHSSNIFRNRHNSISKNTPVKRDPIGIGLSLTRMRKFIYRELSPRLQPIIFRIVL